MSKRILFFGNERLATGVSTNTPVLRALVEAGYQVAAVVVAQHPSGKSRHARDLEVALAAEELGIPLVIADKLKDLTETAKYNAEAAVLIAFGKIMPKEIIEFFPAGIINIHPSLLPKYRGPTPIESAILNGDEETGVSLMKLGDQTDNGPVYAQQKLELSGDETKQEVADKLLNLGKDLLLEALPHIFDGSLKPTAQDEAEVTMSKKITRADGELDLEKPAERLEREVRAYYGWPRSRAMIGTTQMVITKAHAIGGEGLPGTLWLSGKQIGLHTSDGILAIDELVPPGRKPMSAEAFLAGYRPV